MRRASRSASSAGRVCSPTRSSRAFADAERGGFFVTAADAERLITRRKDLEDHPIPSGSSSAALGLLRLAALTRRVRLRAGGARRDRAGGADRAALPDGLRAPAVRDRSAHRRRARGGDRRAGERSAARRRARAPPPPSRAGLRRAHRGQRPLRCSTGAARSTAAPPPISASTSPAEAPVSDPQALQALCWAERLEVGRR